MDKPIAHVAEDGRVDGLEECQRGTAVRDVGVRGGVRVWGVGVSGGFVDEFGEK